MDKIGWAYTMQAVTMAHALQLYNPAAEVKGRKQRAVRNFTAWALYCFQRYVRFINENIYLLTPNSIVSIAIFFLRLL
jgi:hypothetical protein